MEPTPPKLDVRPGRVDDLVFAIGKRLVTLKAPPVVQEVFLESEPILKGLCTHYLGKIRVPGVQRTARKASKKRGANVR